MITNRSHKFITGVFVLIEAALYLHILIANHPLTMFLSIVLCFVYALICLRKQNLWMPFALMFTVAADFFLVLRPAEERLWGMLCFLCVQLLYACHLHAQKPNNVFLWIRLALVILAEGITLGVLRENAAALALISLCYYANLLCNVCESILQFRVSALFPIGLCLFTLCDTVIGLQQMEGYLTISSPLLHSVLYPGFNLAWMFYLPSQVLIALSYRYMNHHTEEVL